MRHTSHVVPLALLAAAANAQVDRALQPRQVVNNPADVGATTVYYSVCPTATQTTITLASTLTYCPGPGCNGGPVITGAPGAGSPGNVPGLGTEIVDYTNVGADGLTTVYQVFETVYGQPCSTCPGGVVPATFTLTEACPCTATRNPASMPEGFTTTVFACDVCAHNGGPMTTTLTVPCSTGPYAAQATNTGAVAGATAGAQAGAGAVAGASGAQATAGANSEAETSSSGSGSSAESGANSGSSSGSGSGTGANTNAQASAGAAAAAGAEAGAGAGSGPGAAGVGGTSPKVVATATLVPAVGAGATAGSGSNGTVSPPISPVSPGGINSYTPGSGSSKTMAVSGVLAGLAGVFAFIL